MKAPSTWNGKRLKYEETFISPVALSTEESAQRVLDAIRAQHSKENGWIELDARIDETPEGFVAVRHHAQYK